MNRLRILKQRANRGRAAVVKLHDGWFAVSCRGWGDCAGPMSRREAIQLAARWGMPPPTHKIVIS